MSADELYSVINGMECQLNILKNEADKLLKDAYLCGKVDQQKETADHLADVNKQVEEAYQKVNDVWEAARKIVCDEDFSVNVLYKIFRKGSSDEILRDFTATEALERIKAYEKEKQKADDEIKVGDEVRNKYHNTTWTAVVTKREGGVIYLMGRGGSVADYHLSNFEKTGRHFDIESILAAMNG